MTSELDFVKAATLEGMAKMSNEEIEVQIKKAEIGVEYYLNRMEDKVNLATKLEIDLFALSSNYKAWGRQVIRERK